MNRRNFIQTCSVAGALFTFDTPLSDWVTIASLGENRAGRVYSESHMAVVARDVKAGTIVRDWCMSEGPEGDVTGVRGMVFDVRRNGEHIQVRIQWTNKPSVPSWVTMHGMCSAPMLPSWAGWTMDAVHHLDVGGEGSNFESTVAI